MKTKASEQPSALLGIGLVQAADLPISDAEVRQ